MSEGWTQVMGEGGQPYYYNEATGETSWEPPAAMGQLVEAGNAGETVAELEAGGGAGGGSDDGFGGAGAYGGELVPEEANPEDDPAQQTYEALSNFDRASVKADGMGQAKVPLAKNIFDTLELHERDEGSACLVELEKRSVAKAAVGSAREVRLAAELVKAAKEERRKVAAGEDSDYSYSEYSYSFSDYSEHDSQGYSMDDDGTGDPLPGKRRKKSKGAGKQEADAAGADGEDGSGDSAASGGDGGPKKKGKKGKKSKKADDDDASSSEVSADSESEADSDPDNPDNVRAIEEEQAALEADEDVVTFKNEDAMIPEYLIFQTKVWEDFACCVTTGHSGASFAALFWAMLLALVCSRTSAGLEVGRSAYNVHWCLRALFEVWFALRVWGLSMGPDYMPPTTGRARPPKAERLAWAARRRLYKIYTNWLVGAVVAITWANDEAVSGAVVYPRVWLRRANGILVLLFFAVIRYSHLLVLPWLFTFRVQQRVADREKELASQGDKELMLHNILNRSRRPVDQAALRDRAKQIAERKLERTISFYGKVYRYHNDAASSIGFQMVGLSFLLEFLHIVSLWPTSLSPILGGIRSWHVVLPVGATMVLLRDEAAVLIRHHAGYTVMLLHAAMMVVPSAASSFMEGAKTQAQTDRTAQLIAIVAYHFFMMLVTFLFERLAIRAAREETHHPLMAVLTTMDALCGNFLIVFASNGEGSSATLIALVLALLRTGVREFYGLEALYKRWFESSEVIETAQDNVEAMELANVRAGQSRARFIVHATAGLVVPIMLGFEGTMGVGVATLSNGAQISLAGAAMFLLMLLNTALFVGAWWYQKRVTSDLWRAVSYNMDAKSGGKVPQPEDSATLGEKWALQSRLMQLHWLTFEAGEFAKSQAKADGQLRARQKARVEKQRKVEQEAAAAEKAAAKAARKAAKSKKRGSDSDDDGGGGGGDEDGATAPPPEGATPGGDTGEGVGAAAAGGKSGGLCGKLRFRKAKAAKVVPTAGDEGEAAAPAADKAPKGETEAAKLLRLQREKLKANMKTFSFARWFRERRKKRWKSELYCAGLVYGAFEATSRAAIVGAGFCNDCIVHWTFFGLAAVVGIFVPCLLLLLTRFRDRILARIERMKKSYEETGRIWG